MCSIGKRDQREQLKPFTAIRLDLFSHSDTNCPSSKIGKKLFRVGGYI
jgi:hypothetical protein